MTTRTSLLSTDSTELRRQEMEFYQAVMGVLEAMPPRSTVADAVASEAGQRIRSKWTLKYAREAPL